MGLLAKDLNHLLSTLTPAQKRSPFVRHALDVQAALTTCNYHAFFAHFLKAPNMGAYIIDHFLVRERVAALAAMTKAYVLSRLLYQPTLIVSVSASYMTLPLSFISGELAFDGPSEVEQFLQDHEAACYVTQRTASSGNGNVDEASKILDCRAAHKPIVEAMETRYRRIGIKGSI